MYLYLHIPFCKSKCIYCDFAVVLYKYGGQQAYVDAACQEIQARFKNIPPQPITTLYVGGGTPSLLPASLYQQIFDCLNQYTTSADNVEITLEINPEAMADDSAAYRALGFNRVSVGIQSFDDAELKKLSRIHTAQHAIDAIHRLNKAGFNNISIDLMYGTPTQTRENWRNTLKTAVALPIQHISMYGLKIEETTPLDRLVTTGVYPLPTEDDTVEMYFEALELLESYGFHRYEFSNLAKPGYESRHNLNYWNNGEYMALGLGAHGYVDGMRYENTREMKAYLDNPLAGTQTPCPPKEQLENAIIFGLRKAKGIDIEALNQQYGIHFETQYGHILKKYEPDGYLYRSASMLALSKKAIPLSNSILADFIT